MDESQKTTDIQIKTLDIDLKPKSLDEILENAKLFYSEKLSDVLNKAFYVISIADAMEISNKNDFDVAGEKRNEWIDYKKIVKETIANDKSIFHLIHSGICKIEDGFLKNFNEAIDVIGKKMEVWYLEEEKKKENFRRFSESKRLEAEKKEKDEIQRQIDEAKLSGNEELVDFLTQEKDSVYVPEYVVPEMQKSNSNTTMRNDLEIKITDPFDFLKWMVENRKTVPIALIKFQESKIKKYVTDMNLAAGKNSLPGIEIIPKKVAAKKSNKGSVL